MRLLPLTPAVVILLLSPVPTFASTGRLAVSGGANLDSSLDEDRPSIALDFLWGEDEWPILLNPYFATSWDRDEETVWEQGGLTVGYEAGIGFSRVWRVGSLHPHLGGGISHLWSRLYDNDIIDIERANYSRSDTGLWASGGVFYPLGSGWTLGTTARLSGLAIGGSHLSGTHVGLTLGWGWPSP